MLLITVPSVVCKMIFSKTVFLFLILVIVGVTIEGNILKVVNPAATKGSKCGNIDTGAPFGEGERNSLLNRHNAYRSELAKGHSAMKSGGNAPTGADIATLKYNCSLEKIAEEWAKHCVFEHSSGSHRNGAGENIWASFSNDGGTPGNVFNSASDSFWSELKQKGELKNGNTKFTADMLPIGHWSQMAWAKTTSVGCGYATCNANNGFKYMHFVVCNYYPAGNYLNENIYDTGSTCSKCHSCDKNTGLCA
uniref:SCP domain-containing protein n=1 Tax=Panagrellus redivivus TaxID=6233 RepID=A0A7E5A0M7_PANRE